VPALISCDVSGNKMSGLLLRQGAGPRVERCLVADNGDYGISVQDAGGAFLDNELMGNGRGAMLLMPSVEAADRLSLAAIMACNRVSGAIVVR